MTPRRFPEDLEPERCPVSSFNTLIIDAPASAIWATLIDAKRWHEHYPNAWRVRLDAPYERLELGAHFRWITFGVPVSTTIIELEVERSLAWRGGGLGSQGFHRWDIEPLGPSRCRVTTEETQRGAFVSLMRWPLKRALHIAHQRWLEGLASASAAHHQPHPN